MAIYKQSESKLLPIKEKTIQLEKDLQSIVEQNLDEVFGLEFISSEFPLNNLRIDTLGFDSETKSFVIIEYKKGQSFSVIDQGYSYLAMLLNNKADFILEYNGKMNKSLNKDDVDWSQSRVIFIANSFTKYQRESIGFQDLPIELWEVKKYDDDLILFNEIKSAEKSESIKTIAPQKGYESVSREIKQYSIEDHVKPGWNVGKELFDDFSQRVLDLDSRIEINPVRSYIGFNIARNNVLCVHIRKSKLMIELLRVKPEDLRDPEERTKYLDNSMKYYNKHVSYTYVKTEEDMDYVLMLVKQVLKKFF